MSSRWEDLLESLTDEARDKFLAYIMSLPEHARRFAIRWPITYKIEFVGAKDLHIVGHCIDNWEYKVILTEETHQEAMEKGIENCNQWRVTEEGMLEAEREYIANRRLN